MTSQTASTLQPGQSFVSQNLALDSQDNEEQHSDAESIPAKITSTQQYSTDPDIKVASQRFPSLLHEQMVTKQKIKEDKNTDTKEEERTAEKSTGGTIQVKEEVTFEKEEEEK